MSSNSVISVSYQNSIGYKLDKKCKFLEKKVLKELLESTRQLNANSENEFCISEIKKRHSKSKQLQPKQM